MSIPPSYTICRLGRLRTDEIINGPNSQPRFYIQRRSWTTSFLLDGPTETSPRIAGYKPHAFKSNEICLGDPDKNATWTPLDRGSAFSNSKYDFRAPDTGRQFVLEKSHDKAFGLSRYRHRGLLLKDAGTGNVVAVMRLLSFSAKERCGIEWLEQLAWDEHLICLMAMIGVYENLKSQNNSSAASSGAPGGAAMSVASGGGGC